MKNPITPIDREYQLTEDAYIVSKTDPKGRITYANEIFMEIAKYDEHELLGVQHNLIRHPDMPRAAFKLLWDTIATGQEFFAYVKNMAKDGSYYWVFANVTADLDDQGRIIGYHSVRRKPRADAIQRVIPLYREMLAIEKRGGPNAGLEASVACLLNVLKEKKVSYEKFILAI
ncbi:PAS domain-containing protein [Gammaproteobacteria bacterium]